jgi:hypothetical protein
MKYILISFLFAACSKQNIFKQQWQIQEGQDTATINHAYFCFKSDYLAMDTIKEYFTVEPDGSYYLKGQIKVKNALPYEGLYIRSYFIYLKQIE